MTKVMESILYHLEAYERGGSGPVSYETLQQAVNQGGFDEALDQLCKEGWVQHRLSGGFCLQPLCSFPTVEEEIIKQLQCWADNTASHTTLQVNVLRETNCNELAFVGSTRALISKHLIKCEPISPTALENSYALIKPEDPSKATPKEDHLSCLPEPWQSVIRKIQPDDIYVITEMDGILRAVRRVPANATASKLHNAVGAHSRSKSGYELRQFIAELARAHGECVSSTYVNLGKP